MASWGQVDFSELVALRDKFQNLQNVIDDFCIQVTQEIAKIVFTKAKYKTPRKTGDLIRAWNTENLKKEGNIYKIEIVNPLGYAEYVEFGHRKRNGKGWTEGFLMLTIAERDLQRNLDKIIREKVNAFIMEALQ
jgi:hypothetical protein